MQPDAHGLHQPCAFDCSGQQFSANPAPYELRQEAEIGDLNITSRLLLKLVVARGRTRDITDPGFQLRPIEITEPPLVAPSEPVDPIPITADRCIEKPVQFGTRYLRFLNSEV